MISLRSAHAALKGRDIGLLRTALSKKNTYPNWYVCRRFLGGFFVLQFGLMSCTTGGLKAFKQELYIPTCNDTEPRATTPKDLVSLRDIGGSFDVGISVSPDGNYVSFLLQQADIETNRYRSGWFVAPTKNDEQVVKAVGDGGAIILLFEESGIVSGGRPAIEARWSPDSNWIAYRLKHDGETQLWRSHRNGTVQEQLTNNAGNVLDLVWSPDGNHIFFKVGKSRESRRLALQEESERGYLFDERFMVMDSTEPVFLDANQADFTTQNHAERLWIYDIQAGEERPVNEAEKAVYAKLAAQESPLQALENRSIRARAQFGSQGPIAWLENENPEKYAGPNPPLNLYAMTQDSRQVRCNAPECSGLIRAPLWSPDGKEIYLIRQEGANQGERGFYGWRPDQDTFRTILRTNDWVDDCELGAGRLVCLHESPTTPRKIVSIDPVDGSMVTLVDPNPEFHELIFTKVEKLEWKESSGADAAGHLVFPQGYQAGQRYPLVIVQYRSRGFLRGGVGDEYPIHPLAANGFFVLSFDRPRKPNLAATIGDTYERERANWGDNLWERSSALSALEIVIEILDDRGLIDPERVGITGLSDGAETLWYALIHSDRFATAIASSGGWTPSWYYLVNATTRRKYFDQAAGLTPPGMGGLERWRRIAPELHAQDINVPILVQVADRELVVSAPTLGALMDAGKPVEAYVFPGEYHIKVQPRHKLAVYERSIDWLNFWLRDVENGDPMKADQYERWRRLRQIDDGRGT